MRSDRRQFLSASTTLLLMPAIPSLAAEPGDTLPVTVQAPAGSVRGVQRNGINLFTGIPFGASTGGTARYRPSRPVAPWNGIFDATRPANVAPQGTNALFPVLPSTPSEDCLQLNIWAPAARGPHPVLVWMHGGGNTLGSCAEPIFDCGIFAGDGIVAINFNYRLGALGFLELGGVLGRDFLGSANNALRDQILALQWVRRNVAVFGGDPEQVTVVGESAGGFDLASLLAAPAGKGLMKRAIISSGGEAVQDVTEADAFAKLFVAQLGGPADRLFSASQDEIVEAQGKAAALWPKTLPYQSVLDPAMLPVRPVEAFAAGCARDVGLMIGCCRDEMRMMVPPAAAGDPNVPPPVRKIEPAAMQQVLAAYAAAYPALSRAELVWKATTAETFAVGSTRIADAQADVGGRVYRYRLDYAVLDGPYGNMTGHGFDVPMVFGQMDSRLARLFGFTAADLPMAKTMHAVWSSFVRTGTVDAGLPQWPLYESQARSTMLIDRSSRVANDTDIVERRIWAGRL